MGTLPSPLYHLALTVGSIVDVQCLSPEIQSLMLKGRISEAVRLVKSNYPGLLENSPELLFRIKCRQFVEMIAGYDTTDLLAPSHPEPRLSCHSELSSSSGDAESPPPPTSPSPSFVGANGEVSVNLTPWYRPNSPIIADEWGIDRSVSCASCQLRSLHVQSCVPLAAQWVTLTSRV